MNNRRRIWFRLGGSTVFRPCARKRKCTEGVPRRDGNADADRVLSVGGDWLTGRPDRAGTHGTADGIHFTGEQYYTEENPCRKRYIALNEDFLTACDSDVEYSESGGVADCRFDSVRLYADRMTAVVQAQTVVWDKRISGNPEQGFSVELPVNRDTITATMKKENGVWKLDSIDSQISLSAAVSADDEVCRERYPTFETARQAADSIDDQAYIKEARFA